MTKNKYKIKNIILISCLMVVCFMLLSSNLFATSITFPSVTIGGESASDVESTSSVLQMVFVLTILALAPSILIMMTSFLRIIISLHFLRSAIGTTTMPPNQILVGLALFLTFFVMSPVFSNIKTNAIDPYQNHEITQEQAIEKGVEPLKEFMLNQVRDEDIKLFMDLSGREPISDSSQILKELPLYVLVPAFVISELRAGFIIGFLIYLPFIVIDMVVSSTLMSMGMMMLPPAMISLPFKVLLFVLVDGWNLIIGQILKTFS